MIYCICIILFLLALILAILLLHQMRDKKIFQAKLSNMLHEVQNENFGVRMIGKSNDSFLQCIYYINEIISTCEKSFIQAKRIERAQKELLTGLSHDIKTPLTSLIGYLEIINKDEVGSEKGKDFICTACKKSYQLKDYIDNLFEWFRLSLQEEALQIIPWDINELTREIIIDWLPQFDKNNLDLNITIPDTTYYVKLDKNAYERIINNLLQNIMRHSNATILSVEIVRDNKNIHLIISDNGDGIAPDKISLIFDRFYQGQEYLNNDKGSGLGLAIVKELVNRLNGNISVQSTPQKGTYFLIEWPEAYKSCL